MQHARKRGHRLGALFAAADRHVRRLVGAEDGQRVLQRFKLVAEVVEFLEGHGEFQLQFGWREKIPRRRAWQP